MAAEYEGCSVCRKNHNEGRKHIYQKGHKTKLSEILKKFTEKTSAVRRMLVKPEVVDGELAPGSRVWCYCCEVEVPKHISDQECCIVWGGMMEHMRSPAHLKCVRHFCWYNGVDQSVGDKMVVGDQEFQNYKLTVSKLLHELMSKKEVARRQLTEEMRVKDTQQHCVAESKLVDHGQGHMLGNDRSQQQLKQKRNSTCSQSNDPKFSQGTSSKRLNVHEGGVPPWLQDDSPSTSVIGPSEEDFIKHKLRIERSKKNSKRVGADFHLIASKETGEDWLPSFGSVWNFGPRSHSKIEFKKKMGNMSVATPTTTPTVATPTMTTPTTKTTGHADDMKQDTATPTTTPFQDMYPNTKDVEVKPYVRKRKQRS